MSGKQKSKKASIPSNVMKRNSDINIHMDKALGKGIEQFPSSKLPHHRAVLQRYRYLRELSHNSATSAIITTITHEVVKLWRHSRILYKDDRACRKKVTSCLDLWKNLNRDISSRENPEFQVAKEGVLYFNFSEGSQKLKKQHAHSLDNFLDLKIPFRAL